MKRLLLLLGCGGLALAQITNIPANPAGGGAPSGPAGGALTGTYPNPTLAGLGTANTVLMDGGSGNAVDATSAATIPGLSVGTTTGIVSLGGKTASFGGFGNLSSTHTTVAALLADGSGLTDFSAKSINVSILSVIGWSTAGTGVFDTGLSRDSAGVIDFGTGAQGSIAGSWKATNGTLSGTLSLANAANVLFNSAETNSGYGFSLGTPVIEKAGSIIAQFTPTGPVFATSVTVNNNALGTTPADGLLLQNTTAAANGAQQISPSNDRCGKGWATTPSTSQTVCGIDYMLPVQGAATPSALWTWAMNINGGGLVNAMTLNQAGSLTVQGTLNAPFGSVFVANIGAFGTQSRGNILFPADGVIELQNNASTSFTRLDLGGTTSSFGAQCVTNQANPIVYPCDATGGNTASLKAVHHGGNGTSPTVAAGGAIGTVPTISGTDFVGTVSVPSSAVTAGTIATVTFGTAYGTAPNCWVTQNGGLVSVGAGHGTPGTGSFTITAAIANVSAAAYTFDYGCSGN